MVINMKKRMPGILALAGLTLTFWVVRVPLFELHKMKDWSLCMFIFGAMIIGIFGVWYNRKILSVFTAAGYIISFFISYLLQFDYGTSSNSMWIIWTCCYTIFILAGIVCGFAVKNKN